ncbi:FIST N-terminal domain-containing protein [Pseudooceanicola onchidii]|uniref:FIST N-terminal domain-containing protein n=1 Tax=Pseudooceanicola onchidii TaxID=2562279 RepID=UPI001F11581F|nr:FIST N-terminal domain-containing protein [Pseudooceanicola onchidii]
MVHKDRGAPSGAQHSLCRAQVSAHDPRAVDKLRAGLGPDPLALVILFISPQADFQATVSSIRAHYLHTDVVACTTAGEIGAGGYVEGEIIAVGFPADHFATTSILIDGLSEQTPQGVLDRIALARLALQEGNLDKPHGFAFLAIDGLSLREDTLTSVIAPALRDMPLFGGSAGDGMDFAHTVVSLNGAVRQDAAVLTMIQTDHRTKVFSIDHLVPTEKQMVVTGADPDRRIVKSINAEPAAREYARLVGKDPDQLDRFTFASHPVVVRIGDSHHVRAIQQVNEAGELVFFSAIDEGMVLTVAEPRNMAEHLQEQLDQIAESGGLTDILGCDCVLRRIQAEQIQATRDLSDILASHKVIGFSTYGEQIGPLHVNHTMTGVAIYAQDPGRS